MRIVLQDTFLCVHIPIVGMVDFQFLAQFPVDQIPHPVVSSLVLLLRLFAAFAYYVIIRFFSFTTKPTLLFCYV